MYEEYTDRLLKVIDFHLRQATVAFGGHERLSTLCAHHRNDRMAHGHGYAEGQLVALRRMHRLIRRAESAPPSVVEQLLLLEQGKWHHDIEVQRLFSESHFANSAYCTGAFDAVATIVAAARRVADAEPLLFSTPAPRYRMPAY